MKSQVLYRWSGVVLVIGGLLSLVSSTVGAMLFPDNNPSPAQLLSIPWFLFELLLFIGLLLIVLSLPGSYIRQSTGAGRLGFAGFLLLWMGILLALGFAGVRIVFWPYLARSAPNLLPSGGQGPIIGFLLWILFPALCLIAGDLLMGVASLRASIYSRPIGLLFISAGVLSLLTFLLPPSGLGEVLDPLSDAALFLAIAWMGYALMAHSKAQVAPQSAQVSTAQLE